jgi:putative PIN family toxin of toxin-antitoxin system
MILTLDTNVIISALGWRGPEFKLMTLIFNGKIKMAISPQILEEFIGVASSKKLGFSEDDVNDFVDALLNTCRIVFPEENISLIAGDPSDNRIIECAAASSSTHIITGDNHLLSLKRYKNIEIMKASDFIKQYII